MQACLSPRTCCLGNAKEMRGWVRGRGKGKEKTVLQDGGSLLYVTTLFHVSFSRCIGSCFSAHCSLKNLPIRSPVWSNVHLQENCPRLHVWTLPFLGPFHWRESPENATNHISRYICRQRSRFPRNGSLLLIGQFKERNAELEWASVGGEEHCVTTLIGDYSSHNLVFHYHTTNKKTVTFNVGKDIIV